MQETATKERCDCPPQMRPGSCPECPYRRWREAEAAKRLGEGGLEIPTFLRAQGGRGGGCCGGR